MADKPFVPPSMTKTWHTDTYDAINPNSRADLHVEGKTVVVAGGGSGIGRAIAQAFADAHAETIAILDLSEDLLAETKQIISGKNSKITITTHVCDIAELGTVEAAAAEIGRWDVLIASAGYMHKLGKMVESDPQDWWRTFEVNVKGFYNLAHAFIPVRSPHANLIYINAGSVQAPFEGVPFVAETSAYNSSKLAALKMAMHLAYDYKDLFVGSLHPGAQNTSMSSKINNGVLTHFDTPELVAHTAVWMCSPEARFLNGRFIWTNWDVEQLKARKDEIEGSLLLTPNCIGWPYTP